MDGTRGYYAKQKKSEKDNYMISLICRIEETRQRIIGEGKGKIK